MLLLIGMDCLTLTNISTQNKKDRGKITTTPV